MTSHETTLARRVATKERHMMDIYRYAKTVETVGRFLGKNGWPIVQPLLEKRMKKENIVGLNFQMHDGCFYKINLINHIKQWF